ncbi:tax1-binding protein 3-like [Amphiura filiformis]|uniref:tax1-binding protein 3-like n=1 Tax=Amphiura filiformis TaxID=82378 RepID=UPI003B20BAAF
MAYDQDRIPCIEIAVVRRPSPTNPSGLGFSIAGGIDQDARQNPFLPNDQGIFVTKVTPEGPAAQAGLQIGDKILEANGFDVTMATHSHAVKIITKDKELVRLKVTRAGFKFGH